MSAVPDTQDPTLIIPTKFRLLLADMAKPQEKEVIPVATPSSVSRVPEGSTSPVRMESDAADQEILLTGLKQDALYSGLGRGFVQTSFDVSFDEPGRKIDNRERLTARGLFNVHVSHGFN
jgi:hypothetical protein